MVEVFVPKEKTHIYKEFIEDPVLAIYAIFGKELAPHSKKRITAMWNTKFFMDCSGYSSFKTHDSALFVCLQFVLIPNRISAFISHTFVGAQLLFNYVDSYYETCPTFRMFCKKSPSHDRGLHRCVGINKSEIRALAPDILKDSERLQSERWNVLVADEFTRYHKPEVINNVMISRVTRPSKNFLNDDKFNIILGNHIIFTGTARFKHLEIYKSKVLPHLKEVLAGNKLYDYQSWSYKDVPERFSYLVEKDIVEEQKKSLPKLMFKMLWEGEWVDTSDGYYNIQTIEECRNINLKILKKREKEEDIYVAGIDVARLNDDFTIAIMRLRDNKYAELVYLFRYNKLDLETMSGIIHDFNLKFNFNLIVMDAGGGGIYLADKLSNKKQTINGKSDVSVYPILTFDTVNAEEGQSILVLFSPKDIVVKQLMSDERGNIFGSDYLNNLAHNNLKSALERKEICLPATVEDYTGHIDPETYTALENIENMITELCCVGIKKNREGLIQYSNKGFLQFTSSKKKDSAYAFLYANVAKELYFKMNEDFDISEDKSVVCI